MLTSTALAHFSWNLPPRDDSALMCVFANSSTGHRYSIFCRRLLLHLRPRHILASHCRNVGGVAGRGAQQSKHGSFTKDLFAHVVGGLHDSHQHLRAVLFLLADYSYHGTSQPVFFFFSVWALSNFALLLTTCFLATCCMLNSWHSSCLWSPTDKDCV